LVASNLHMRSSSSETVVYATKTICLVKRLLAIWTKKTLRNEFLTDLLDKITLTQKSARIGKKRIPSIKRAPSFTPFSVFRE
jgi:hypothetical protein